MWHFLVLKWLVFECCWNSNSAHFVAQHILPVSLDSSATTSIKHSFAVCLSAGYSRVTIPRRCRVVDVFPTVSQWYIYILYYARMCVQCIYGTHMYRHICEVIWNTLQTLGPEFGVYSHIWLYKTYQAGTVKSVCYECQRAHTWQVNMYIMRKIIHHNLVWLGISS